MAARVPQARARRELAQLVVCAALLALGLLALGLGLGVASDVLLLAATALGLVIAGVAVVRALRRRQPSVDLIAVLALVGAVLVHEYVAGAVVALMLATGQMLEAGAQARASRALTRLVERAPRTARLRRGSDVLTLPVGEVVVGDRVLVGPGEVVPVDGRLLTPGTFDESALSGEPLPVDRPVDDLVRSGVVDAGSPVELVATSTAAESTYAGVVRLVEQAAASTAPFVRMADRLGAVFVPIALAVAGAAWWASGDAVRAVAVLVVATPCPLILAAPIAVMTGLSRAARAGVVVKGGAALERLADGRVLLFDKTGTLTRGRPVVVDVPCAPGRTPEEVLSLAASLDQLSPHVLAASVVAAARARGARVADPSSVREVPGSGIEGVVDGVAVRVGRESWVVGDAAEAWVRQARRRAALDGALTVYVSVDGVTVGAIVLEDPIRIDAPRMIRALRSVGITRTVLVSGDRADVAEAVGRLVGVDAVRSEQDPASKVEVVRQEGAGGPTIMVGDGVNDAPALAAAGVGVALAARGSSASSEAADVVLTVDRIDALADAVLVARRSRRIARVAAVVGMSLSVVAMGVAAVGLLAPTAGAILQEGIDVLAIGIALTGLLPAAAHTVRLSAEDAAVTDRLQDEHREIAELVEQVRVVADALDSGDVDLAPVRRLVDRLESELVPHERREEELLLPVVARALGGPDPTGALSRTHAEIEHQVARLRRLVSVPDDEAAAPDDVIELRRVLYGLYAVLRLHNAQEDESAFSLLPPPDAQPGRA